MIDVIQHQPSYQEMGMCGKSEIDQIDYKKAIKHWLFLIDSKEDGHGISQELINSAWEQVEIEEEKLKRRKENDRSISSKQ